jgi:hypothetical protein
LDDLKDKILVVPNPEPIQVDLNELEIKKQGRRKIQRSPDINFKNKRHGRLISRTLRNRHRDHEKPIPVIEVDDRISEDDIDDQIPEDDIDVDTPQFDFVSNLPPFLKKQQGFSGIQHDLKRIMEQDKLPTTEQTRPLPSMELVHCENCFDWIERYYQDVPYLQAQLNQVVTQNSVLERENDELRACVRSNAHRANKRIKRSGNVVIKNSTNFNTIINSDLSDASLSNF